MADPRRERRPRLRTILLAVNLLVLLVPLGLFAVLRLYETGLVRATEAQLLAQGALVREAYRRELGHPAPAGPLDEDALRATLPRLDVRGDRIRPPAEPALPPPAPAETRAAAAGARLAEVLRAASRETLSGIRVVDAGGVVVASSGEESGLSLSHREEVAGALAGRRVSLLRVRSTDQPRPALESIRRGQRYRVFVALPVEADGRVVGAVVLSRTPLDISKALWLNRGPLAVAASIFLVVLVGITSIVSFAVARPLRALIRQARRAEAGERGALQEIPRPGIAEIAELSAALASMARTLEHRGGYIRTFAGHVSHEFKTPLTTIRGAVELLQDHEAAMSAEQRRDFIARIDESARRLERLVARLLDLARADVAGPTGGACEALTVARSVAARFTESGFPVEAGGAEARVGMDEAVLDGILTSLIENARLHGGRHGTIGVAGAREPIVIDVADDGPGVSEANAARLFTPFFTTARDRGGSGLGLSIARSLVEAHGGTLELVAPGPRPVFRIGLRRAVGSAVLVAAALGATAARAQGATPLSAGDKSIANFAFATQLGSGIYAIDGRTVQIYRIPLAYTVRRETQDRWGLKVTFPLTVGFYDFKAGDVLEAGLPDDLDTVSLVPGIEFRVLARPNLLVKPFLEAGVAREGTQDVAAYVSSFGLRTLASFRKGGFDVDLGNALVYARVDPKSNAGPSEDFITLQASSQARHGMGLRVGGRELDYGLYASVEVYSDEPDFPLPSDGGWSSQYEVGTSFGTREDLRLWKIKIPRIGLGYRFGGDASAVRFVIGTPAPSLKR